jgi:hypothetical protein
MAISKGGDSFEDYMKKKESMGLNSSGLFSRANLKPIPDSEMLSGNLMSNDVALSKLVAEGNRLIAEEEKLKAAKAKTPVKDESKKLETKLGKTSSNPYIRARAEVLEQMDPGARTIIEKMEAGSLPKDSRYTDFCKKVATRGDQFSGNN